LQPAQSLAASDYHDVHFGLIHAPRALAIQRIAAWLRSGFDAVDDDEREIVGIAFTDRLAQQ